MPETRREMRNARFRRQGRAIQERRRERYVRAAPGSCARAGDQNTSVRSRGSRAATAKQCRLLLSRDPDLQAIGISKVQSAERAQPGIYAAAIQLGLHPGLIIVCKDETEFIAVWLAVRPGRAQHERVFTKPQ